MNSLNGGKFQPIHKLEQKQVEIPSSSYDQESQPVSKSVGKPVNLIVVSDNKHAGQGVQAAKDPPGIVPANHMAVHVPDTSLHLRQLEVGHFNAAESVYLGARPDPEKSLYARGQYWYGRMKNWFSRCPNEPRIEGVDQSFWGFTKDVVGEGWGFIYDQLKTVRAYGTGLFGFSSAMSSVRSGEAQIEVYRTFSERRQDVEEALTIEFQRLNKDMRDELKDFREATRLSKSNDEEEKQRGMEALKKFTAREITSEKDIEEHYHAKGEHFMKAMQSTLQMVAVNLNPDYVAEREKVTELWSDVAALKAQLAIAEDAKKTAEEQAFNILASIELEGNRFFSFKDLDKADAAEEKAKAKCAAIQAKLDRLEGALDTAAERLKVKAEALLEQEGDLMYANLEADAELGKLLVAEGTTDAMKTWTWSINDLLKTIQYGCTGLGVLGIPIVSPIALGISLVTGGLSLAMYGEDTVHRGKEAHHAGKVKSALSKMEKTEESDPGLAAIRTLIEKNLSYKEKSVKAFFTSLGIVSTLSALGLAVVNVLAVAGVVASGTLAMATPIGWGIGGACLVAGLAFGAYSGIKAIYRYYKEYKAEQLLEEALKMRDNPSMEGSKAYNRLFMEELEQVDEVANLTDADIKRLDEAVLSRMETYCTEEREKMEALKDLVQGKGDVSDESKAEYERLFEHFTMLYQNDALNFVGYDPENSSEPMTSGQLKGVHEYIQNKILGYVDAHLDSLDEIQEDLDNKTELSDAYLTLKGEMSRIVAGEKEKGLMQDRIKIANDRIIEQSFLKLMERRPDYGLRVLVQRIRSGDEAAIKFVEDIDVFKPEELKIIQGASTASESRVLELMMKRLGFDT